MMQMGFAYFAHFASLLCVLFVIGPAQADGWGTIKGHIVWPGDAPPPKAVEAVKTHQDKQACEANGAVVSEELVVNKANKGMRWVFIWLVPEEGKKLQIHPGLAQLAPNEVVIDQPCCQFEPRAVGVREGQTLVVKNSAPVAHNVNWGGGPKNSGSNLIIPAKGEPIRIKDLVPDKYPVKIACNIHPWMHGWVRVFDHPYFAVTDADGKFEIRNAPAGKHQLMIWHESGFLGGAAGRNGRPVQIDKDVVTDLGKIEWKK